MKYTIEEKIQFMSRNDISTERIGRKIQLFSEVTQHIMADSIDKLLDMAIDIEQTELNSTLYYFVDLFEMKITVRKKSINNKHLLGFSDEFTLSIHDVDCDPEELIQEYLDDKGIEISNYELIEN